MKRHQTLARVIALAMLLVMVLVQETWALAGTTGGISGRVTDERGTPVANARVIATSPSGQSSATSDENGRFLFLQLAPDSYTLAVSKAGYAAAHLNGVTVFADQNQTADILVYKEVGTVTTTSSQLVRSGVTTDVYAVSGTQAEKAAALGGGGNLDSAYSAIASAPGVVVPANGAGWNQPVFIRGSQFFFTGFEYDGVPVNRAFDNYAAHTASNLGQQQLQVYTGGGPASSSSAGTSGFVNQVIKTGTYPGSGGLALALGGPSFYHEAKAEAGGASPDRNFSYYAGISGYDQTFRVFDQNNGASLMNVGSPLASYSGVADLGPNGQGVLPACEVAGVTEGIPTDGTGAALTNPATGNPIAAGDLIAPTSSLTNPAGTPGCLTGYNGIYGLGAEITDRENVANFHVKLPRKNGQKDDIQLLVSDSSLRTFNYGSPNEGGLGAYTIGGAVTGNNFNAPTYQDATVFNVPFGTPVAGLTPANYYQPSSPTNRPFGATIPLNARDNLNNDAGIMKLQYTHPFSDRAYARAFAYSFFSDWTQAGALDAFGYGQNISTGPSPNYDLITHTLGGELQIADQLNDKHLSTLTINSTQAKVTRFNNTGFLGGASLVGLLSRDGSGMFHCFNPDGSIASCASGGWKGTAAPGLTDAPAGTPAALAGARTVSLWDGNAQGTFNTVQPNFTFASLNDQFRPNDKWLFNLGLRFEDYNYKLASSTTAANDFYSQNVAQFSCYNPTTGQVATKPLGPGVAPPAPVKYTGIDASGNPLPCSSLGAAYAGYFHPDGSAASLAAGVPKFTDNSPSNYDQRFYSLRLSGSYAMSPDTVIRFQGGRFTEPPISASVQYLNRSGNAQTLWANFENLGFFSPFHPIPIQSAAQYDASLERHIRGTQASFKISPFYNLTSAYQVQSFIGQGFVTQIPTGQFRSYGVESQFNLGDFNRNGFSGLMTLSYTNAKVKYQTGLTPNNAGVLNQVIDQYNALTKSGGGQACYKAGTATGEACTAADAITNPYYNAPAQSHLDVNGWYAPPSFALVPGVNNVAGYYDTPWTSTLLLNYRHNKLAVTPSLQFFSGSSYGTPLDVSGLDPRVCTQNAAAAGITALSPGTDPHQCNYLSSNGLSASPFGILYIPNPQTGQFASPGQYREPNFVGANVAFSYEVSPKVTANLTLANVYHNCFGGTKAPWTSAYPVDRNNCGYAANAPGNLTSGYVSNFYNGTGPTDKAANGASPLPFELQSYTPTRLTGSSAVGTPIPFSAYFSVNIKL